MGELRMSKLIDTFGRVHRDIRVSLTDRCNLRCTYCMPHDFAAWMPTEDLLTTDELMTILEVGIDAGIDEVRLTGGEPLLNRDNKKILQHLDSLGVLPDLMVSYNTNGTIIPDDETLALWKPQITKILETLLALLPKKVNVPGYFQKNLVESFMSIENM